MASFIPKKTKTADDGSQITLCVDGHLAWFVERPDDRKNHAHPMGAFQSEEDAKRWAEHHFPGGEWTSA